MKIFLYVFLCVASSALSQNIKLKGQVRFEDNNAAEAANVVLQKQDSVFVTGTSTDSKGHFALSMIEPGDYRLVISMIGFQEIVTELKGLAQSVDLGEFVMREEAEALDEVTVTAANVINKSDRKLIFPNQQQLAASTNGVNLLNALQLPRISVSIMDNTVSLTTKETLQLRVNGVKVTEQELMAIQPQDVIRIEYIENPGLRYENAGAVLNYIVRRHESGGSVSFSVLQSPYEGLGNYNFSSKLSYKKSEFGVNYMGMLRQFNKVSRENEERFLFEDGRELIKEEIPEPGSLTNNGHQLLLNYNIQASETDYVNVTAGYYRAAFGEDYYSQLKNSWHPDQVTQMTDLSSDKSDRPWLDLYWSHAIDGFSDVQDPVLPRYFQPVFNRRKQLFRE